jgi:large subunit ribosomal protein L13
MNKTYMQKTAEVTRKWHLIDAENRVLGQVATEIAVKLMGKEKTTFTPHIDAGDFVVVINASKIIATGAKGDRKMYYKHSHLPGGITENTFNELLEKKPAEIIQRAVFNMLPKNRLRQDRMGRLKVYGDANHKHESQIGKNS